MSIEMSPVQQLADLKLTDGLEKWLRRRRNEGLSYEKIARELVQVTTVEVSAATIGSWLRQFDIVEGE